MVFQDSNNVVRFKAVLANLQGNTNTPALGVAFVSKSYFYASTKRLHEASHELGGCTRKAVAMIKISGRDQP